jgi:hypothetical protein
MKYLLPTLILGLLSSSAWAQVQGTVPEPETLLLLAIGAAGLLAAKRGK